MAKTQRRDDLEDYIAERANTDPELHKREPAWAGRDSS
jgi:hypothetical protein